MCHATAVVSPSNNHRTPQETIASNILGTTKVQAAINNDMNQSKAITSLLKFNFDVFNFI